MLTHLERGFRIGEFTVRPLECALEGPSGKQRLQPKVMAVLVCLAEHAGDTVVRDDILKTVWGPTIVGDESLTRCVSELRHYLLDNPKHPRYLQTIPKIGYRLLADVSMERPAETVTEPPQVASAPLVVKPAPERRQISVVHCTFQSGNADSQRLDAESFCEILPDLQNICHEVAVRFEGHALTTQTEDVLVFFGYPNAHEDDARRAVLAGLGIVEAINQIGAGPGPDADTSITAKVGIDSGWVVVELDTSGIEPIPHYIGEVSKVAARLCHRAGMEGVLISDATAQLTSGFFHTRPVPAFAYRNGQAETIAFEAFNASNARSRLESQKASDLTPLVGRKHEIKLLIDRWIAALESIGQTILLSGEAGIGKSRLVQSLKEHVSSDTRVIIIELYCSTFYKNTVLYPAIAYLELELQFKRHETPEQRFQRLVGFVTEYGMPLAETVPLFASLLSLPLGDGYHQPQLSTQRQRERTLNALIHVLHERAKRQPVLLIVEDLHWADSATVELIDRIVGLGPARNLMMVCTFRPEFRAPFGNRADVAMMTVTRLTPTHVRNMVEHIAGEQAFPSALCDRVIEQSSGVPLFVEEMTKALIESAGKATGSGKLAGDWLDTSLVSVPATLQETLAARLDHLGEAKSIAQLGAVLGREFSFELIEAVASIKIRALLATRLSQLVKSELLYQIGEPPDATYRFKHSLIRDAAYESLLKRQRRSYHKKTALTLENRFPDKRESAPEIFAHHYTGAGLYEQAVPCWQDAGERAHRRSANAEAAHHFSQGLRLLEKMPASTEHAWMELRLQTALGPALMAIKGYSAPEVESAYRRASELCECTSDPELLARSLSGLWTFHVVRGDLLDARSLGEQLLQLSSRVGSDDLALEAHVLLGVTLFHIGDVTDARDHLNAAIAAYDMESHAHHAYAYGQDPGMAAHAYLGSSLWWLGFPEQAAREAEVSIAIARRLNHRYSLAFALCIAARCLQKCGDHRRVLELTNEAIQVSIDHGFPTWGAMATLLRGWALLAGGGDADAGLQAMTEGLEAYRVVGTGLSRPYYKTMLAHVYGERSRVDDALQLLDEALEEVERSGGRAEQAELYRTKGELLARCPAQFVSDETPDAEALFRLAFDHADQQGAVAWRLRAAVSLSRLLGDQGRRREAQEIVRSALGAFTEGFERPDLVAAAGLMKSLKM